MITRAGLDPALTAGRGAQVAFLEQEAENLPTNGTVLEPSRDAYTPAAEASGRSAVVLQPGQWLDVTLPAATNGITVRYSLPDAPRGGGVSSTLAVQVGGRTISTMALTSAYSYLYNQYSFTNDPQAGLLHPDWWLTECGCVPGEGFEVAKPFRPMKFFAEQRQLLDRSYPAGSVLRLQVPAGAQVTTIDLVDTELVAPPKPQPANSVSIAKFMPNPKSGHDASRAFTKTIEFARKHGQSVYIPPGTWSVSEHIIVDDITVTGAGNWHSIVTGREVALATKAPDGSVHTGVGFYGRDASVGGSHNVHLSDFAIVGDVKERIDTDQVNGIGGALSHSTIERLHISRTKVGIWLDGPMTQVHIADTIIVDQVADAVNFHTGVTQSSVRNTFVRNSGDDGLAMWSEGTANAGNTFSHNTVQTPTLANGIAIYGGADITVANNLVADPVREGSALHAGARFGATAFTGSLNFTDNTTVRAGTFELNWKIGLGALWIYALDQSIDQAAITISGGHRFRVQAGRPRWQ